MNEPQNVCDCCRLVPLSYLSLDVSEPLAGWEQALTERGVEKVLDDIGRPSVERGALGELIAEHQARVARSAAQQAEKAVARKVTVPVAGIPAAGEDMSAFETLMAQPDYQSVKDEFGLPRPRFLEEQLAEGQRQQATERAEREAVENARKMLQGRDK